MKNELDNTFGVSIILTKGFIEFPKGLDKRCTEKEFHKMMTFHDSDIPIENVIFLDYPDIKAKL
jgi:hypothetical protein